MNCIVVGALNTDLIIKGVSEFPKSGEYVYGDELSIMPGGRSRNIASMIGLLVPKKSVAVVGRTVADPYGLWKVPIDALRATNVATDYVQITDYNVAQKLPGIVVIPVNRQGANQLYAMPSITRDFSTADIDAAKPLFDEVAQAGGTLVSTLEFPIATATYAVKQAVKKGIKVLLDPGGVEPGADITELLRAGVYLIKPNDQETRILTGKTVTDFDSAATAAAILRQQGAENVLITVGADGAYLFTDTQALHIPAPTDTTGDIQDETGCGDQAMAVLCVALQAGKSLEEAARQAVYAGTMQFYRQGIQPLTKTELHKIFQ